MLKAISQPNRDYVVRRINEIRMELERNLDAESKVIRNKILVAAFTKFIDGIRTGKIKPNANFSAKRFQTDWNRGVGQFPGDMRMKDVFPTPDFNHSLQEHDRGILERRRKLARRCQEATDQVMLGDEANALKLLAEMRLWIV